MERSFPPWCGISSSSSPPGRGISTSPPPHWARLESKRRIFRYIESRIGPHAYVNNYGFTEATGIVTLSFRRTRPRSAGGKWGKPLEGMEVKVAGQIRARL